MGGMGGMPGMMQGPPGFPGQMGGGMPMGGPMPGFQLPTGPELPPGVPPPPTIGGQGGVGMSGEMAFGEFMNAFRTEMRDARDGNERKQKYVPSAKVEKDRQKALEERANEIFGVGTEYGAAVTAEEEDAFDEWPDEFLLLGVAQQDAEQASSPSPDSDTSTTSETERTTSDTEETEETELDDDEDDAWPLELLIG